MMNLNYPAFRINFNRTPINKAILFIALFMGVLHLGWSQTTEQISWRKAQHQEKNWYGSKEARRIADNVLLYQNNNGGWLKNIDMAKPLDESEQLELQKKQNKKSGTTIDNGATHTQLKYLAKVYSETGEQSYKKSFIKGVDYLLEAQYENGGWPQFYPIKKGYYEHITYNDGAMMGVMDILRDIAKQKEPYTFVDANRRKKAQQAIDKGLRIILDSQIRIDGELTIWCAQHDKKYLSPAKARAYELPSLSGKESVGIVEYLMKIENPSEEIKTAIRSAVKWYEENKITGQKVVWKKDESLPEAHDRVVVKDPEGSPLWGRFNEIGTNRPMFVGRDGVGKDHLEEIEHERRIGYNYIDSYAEDLLEKDFPKWQESHQ